MELTFARSNRQVVDARDSALHEAAIVELPVLVAIGPIPVAAIVMPLIREANGNAVALTGPKLFDEPIVELLGPFACQELPYRVTTCEELGAVAPNAVGCVGKRAAFRIAAVPRVLGHAHLLRRGLGRERREGRTGWLGGWHLPHSQRLAFLGKPGRCTLTTQNRWPVGACITTQRSSRFTTLAPMPSKRATSAGMLSVSM